MTNSRLSQRINITIDPDLLRRIDRETALLGQPRSRIISDALHDWLGSHKTPRPPKAFLVNGQPYDPNKLFKDYFSDQDTPEDSMRILEEHRYAAEWYSRD